MLAVPKSSEAGVRILPGDSKWRINDHKVCLKVKRTKKKKTIHAF